MPKHAELLDELRSLDNDQLEERINDAKEEQFNLRFQKAIGQLENTGRLKELRRDLARMQTVLRQRQLAAELLQEEANG